MTFHSRLFGVVLCSARLSSAFVVGGRHIQRSAALGASARVEAGDVVKVRWSATTAAGDGKQPLPEEVDLFDQGDVTFVVDGGGFLPALHASVKELEVGEVRAFDIVPEQAFGESNPNMGPVDVPASQAPSVSVGDVVRLSSGATARVTANDGTTITIDANHPLAGKPLSLEVEVLERDDASSLETFTCGLGCFWGGELAYQRAPGVVETKVGYTQGEVEDPSYEDVCEGATGHTEGINARFDPTVATYGDMLSLFWERLGESRFLKNQVGNDRGTQYRHGIYYHSREQEREAKASLEAEQAKSPGRAIVTEIEPAARFYDAEEYHMQYLMKNGQSAKKTAVETIRCYG